MCLLVMASRTVAGQALLVGANRDERLARPAVAMTVLQESGPRILGGRDLQAGGTWLAVNEHGVVAGLTNTPTADGRDPTKCSRGTLPLRAAAHASAAAAVEALLAEVDPEDFNPAWLLVGDRTSLFAVTIAGDRPTATELPAGVHVLENCSPGTPSGKVDHVTARLLASPGPTSGGGATTGLAGHLRQVLADHTVPVAQPADEGRAAELRAACVHLPDYGTRSSALVSVPAEDDVPPAVAVADGPPCRASFEDRSGLWEESPVLGAGTDGVGDVTGADDVTGSGAAAGVAGATGAHRVR